jgi:dephospho-CoA kinase
MSIIIIGITGNSASGKTTVSEYYRKKGFTVADGDEITHNIYKHNKSCLGDIKTVFGSEIFEADGSLNRKKLARIVYEKPENNEKLLAIVHPYIIEQVLSLAKQAQTNGEKLFFLDGAMIIGSPVQKYCNKIILLTQKKEQLIEKIKQRDNISAKQAKLRLAAQPSFEYMSKNADYIIENCGNISELYKKADEVLKKLHDGFAEILS